MLWNFWQKHEDDCQKFNHRSDEFKEEIQKIRAYTNISISKVDSTENSKPHRKISMEETFFEKKEDTADNVILTITNG